MDSVSVPRAGSGVRCSNHGLRAFRFDLGGDGGDAGVGERGGAEEGPLRRQQRLREEEAAAAARAGWAGWGPEGLLGAAWALEDCAGP